MASQLSPHIQCHRLSCKIYSLQYCIEVVTITYLRLSGGLAIHILMHSVVFIGSCDVIRMEFPKGEVGLLVLGDVFSLVILTSVCVCVLGIGGRKGI